MPTPTVAALLALLLTVFGPVLAQTEYKLTAFDGAEGDQFGASVSVAGDVALVGANKDDYFTGSAYVFRYDGVQWVEEQKLTASDGSSNDSFGTSVSIADSIALIGAHFDNPTGGGGQNGYGAVYVFRYDGSNWVEEQKLTASDGNSGDLFGRSVSLSDSVILVGAYLDGDAGADKGSAYIFRYNGTSWVEEQKLTASDAASRDYFGRSVALSGNVALVGAYGDDDRGLTSGSAYVFRYDGTEWVQDQKLRASDGDSDDLFGLSVALSEDVALIGAYVDDDNGESSGSAYVFRYEGAQWTEEQKLTASDGAAFDWFGESVAIAHGVALVGSNRDDDNGEGSGSAYVYRYDGSNWVEEQKLAAFDGDSSDRFGRSVSLSDDIILVGALRDDENGEGSGSAYLYDPRTPSVLDLSATALTPLTVAPGGSIQFEYTVTNGTADPVSGDLFFTAERKGTSVGSGVVTAGTLQPGQSVTGQYYQNIPANAPSGTYDYALNIGQFSSLVIDAEPFTVTITNAARTPSLIEAWSVSDVTPWGAEPEAAASEAQPEEFALHAAYPNPFTRATTVSYALPKPDDVRLTIHDVLGRQVLVLVEGTVEAGVHEAMLDGSSLPSGSYLVRLVAGGTTATQRVTLVR